MLEYQVRTVDCVVRAMHNTVNIVHDMVLCMCIDMGLKGCKGKGKGKAGPGKGEEAGNGKEGSGKGQEAGKGKEAGQDTKTLRAS